MSRIVDYAEQALHVLAVVVSGAILLVFFWVLWLVLAGLFGNDDNSVDWNKLDEEDNTPRPRGRRRQLDATDEVESVRVETPEVCEILSDGVDILHGVVEHAGPGVALDVSTDQAPGDVFLVVRMDSPAGEPMHSQLEDFADGDGLLFTAVRFKFDEERRVWNAACYVPYAAVPPMASEFTLHVRIQRCEDLEVLESGELQMEWPDSVAREENHLAALVEAAVAVSRQDGALNQSEARAIKVLAVDLYGLTGPGLHVLKRYMKNANSRNPVPGAKALAAVLAARFGDSSIGPLVEILRDIAQADGPATQAEAQYLKSLCEHLDADPDVREFVASLSPATLVDEHLRTLGLQPNATLQQVRSARVKLVREYHPDVIAVHNLPAGYEEFANQKLAAINEAYEYLKHHY